MGTTIISRRVFCPFCHRSGKVTIETDGKSPRSVEIERGCPHLDDEYDEDSKGIYIHFRRGDRRDHVFVPGPLALFLWAGDPNLVARALRRRGYDVRTHGRLIIFERPPRAAADVVAALHQYMLRAGRTISYQIARL